MENPAYKLHSLLNEAYNNSYMNKNLSYKTVWCNVFDIDKKDTSAFLKSLNLLLDLYLDTRNYILENERLNTELNIMFLDRIHNGLDVVNFEGTMSSFHSMINSETLTALNYMGQSLEIIYDLDKESINKEEINILIDDIDNLLENITDSLLPEDVKLILFKNLNLIRESLQLYKISGVEGVRTALEQTIGSIFMHNKEILSVNDDENVKGTFNIIDKLNTLLSTGVGFKELIVPMFDHLLK